jgi:hypothetical protein
LSVVRGPLFVEGDFVFAGSQLKKKNSGRIFFTCPKGLGLFLFALLSEKK